MAVELNSKKTNRITICPLPAGQLKTYNLLAQSKQWRWAAKLNIKLIQFTFYIN